MFIPVFLAYGASGAVIVMLALAVAGAATSAVGTIQAGKQQKAALDAQAQQDENNATRAGQAAVQAGEQADREAQEIAAQRRRMIGQNIASASKSGLTIGGSIVDTMTDSALQAEQDIQMAIYRGQATADNYGAEASSLRFGAKMARTAGKNAVTGSYYSATGSLLSTAGSVGTAYASMPRTGAVSKSTATAQSGYAGAAAIRRAGY